MAWFGNSQIGSLHQKASNMHGAEDNAKFVGVGLVLLIGGVLIFDVLPDLLGLFERNR